MIAGEKLPQNLSSLMQSVSLGNPKLRVSPLNKPLRLCSSSHLREANQHCNLLFLAAEFSEQKAELSSAHSHSGQIQSVFPSHFLPSLSLHPLLNLPHPRKAVCGSWGLVSLPWNPITVGCCEINVHSHEIML